jgi:hypothetical protein
MQIFVGTISYAWPSAPDARDRSDLLGWWRFFRLLSIHHPPASRDETWMEFWILVAFVER